MSNPNLDDWPGLDVDHYNVQNLYLLFEKLAHTASGLSAPSRTPFATAVLLNGNLYMPPTRVSGPLDFTHAAGAVAPSYNKVKLTADGVHVPTFSGFTQETNAQPGQGWTNVPGTVHIAYFWYDGVNYKYTLYPL